MISNHFSRAQKIIRSGAIFALLAVILGAFGAHGLAERIDHDNLRAFETGVRYQFYHSLALLLIGILAAIDFPLPTRTISRLFVAGIWLFSGSLYGLSIDELFGVSASWLGPLTPIGGLLFLSGWFVLILKISTLRRN